MFELFCIVLGNFLFWENVQVMLFLIGFDVPYREMLWLSVKIFIGQFQPDLFFGYLHKLVLWADLTAKTYKLMQILNFQYYWFFDWNFHLKVSNFRTAWLFHFNHCYFKMFLFEMVKCHGSSALKPFQQSPWMILEQIILW